MAGVNDDPRAELLARAGRDQAARESLPPGYGLEEWDRIVEPVDRAASRARLIQAEGLPGPDPDDQQPGAAGPASG
jgi:hypothetical protein